MLGRESRTSWGHPISGSALELAQEIRGRSVMEAYAIATAKYGDWQELLRDIVAHGGQSDASRAEDVLRYAANRQQSGSREDRQRPGWW